MAHDMIIENILNLANDGEQLVVKRFGDSFRVGFRTPR